MTEVKKTAIDLARREHTYCRQNVKDQLLRALDELANTSKSVRESVESENQYAWWADHSQGLAYSAGKVERLLNNLISWDRAIVALDNAERYAEPKDA